jgi:hypothetical protein
MSLMEDARMLEDIIQAFSHFSILFFKFMYFWQNISYKIVYQ